MGIFRDDTIQYYTDWMTMRGYNFKATIGIGPRRGTPLAIHCGRIVSFELEVSDEPIAYFEYGTWYQWPDFEDATLVIDLIIAKWKDYNPKPEDKAIMLVGGAEEYE